MADLGRPLRVIEVTPLELPVPSEPPVPTPVEEPRTTRPLGPTTSAASGL